MQCRAVKYLQFHLGMLSSHGVHRQCWGAAETQHRADFVPGHWGGWLVIINLIV